MKRQQIVNPINASNFRFHALEFFRSYPVEETGRLIDYALTRVKFLPHTSKSASQDFDQTAIRWFAGLSDAGCDLLANMAEQFLHDYALSHVARYQ